MPRVMLDFVDVDPEPRNYEPLPKGVYVATIDTSEARAKGVQTSKTENRTPYVTLVFVCEGEGRTVKVWDRIMLAGRGTFRAGQLLNAVGQKVKKGDRAVVFDTDALEGKRLKVRLDVEPYETEDEDGRTVTRERNVVVRYLPLSSVPESAAAGFVG